MIHVSLHCLQQELVPAHQQEKMQTEKKYYSNKNFNNCSGQPLTIQVFKMSLVMTKTLDEF